MNPPEHLTIMIMEDNRADVYLLKQALQKAELNFTAFVFEDGQSAFEYMENDSATEAKPVPDLAILDLNVPKRDGSEVLAYIRSDPRYQNIAVVVLSSSPKQDICKHAARADCYITKPLELDEFLKIGHEIRECVESVRARTANLSVPGHAWAVSL